MMHLDAPHLIDNLGWTLIHALWQGTLLAAVAALPSLLKPRANAVFQYRLHLLCLLALPVASLITFVLLQGGSAAGPVVQQMGVGNADPAHHLLGDIGLLSERSFFNDWMYAWVGLWLLGVSLLALRSVGGYVVAQRMCRLGSYEPDPYWQGQVDRLRQRMGIARHVVLRMSERVQVPMVMGFVKPVILLPVNIMTGLSNRELEAILLHELAHVRRYDYLVNILQTLVETVFFFHPLVWWQSHRIRSLREACCDDLAVAVLRDSLTFARALAHLEEVNMKVPQAAMALNGRGGHLMQRIRRLIQPGDVQTSTLDRVLGPVLVLATVAVFFLSSLHLQAAPSPFQDDRELEAMDFAREVFSPDGEHRITMNDREYEILMEDGELVLFEIDGEVQPLSAVLDHKEVFRDLYQEHEQLEKARVVLERRAALIDAEREEQMRELEKFVAMEKAQIAEMEHKAHRLKMEGNRREAEKIARMQKELQEQVKSRVHRIKQVNRHEIREIASQERIADKVYREAFKVRMEQLRQKLAEAKGERGVVELERAKEKLQYRREQLEVKLEAVQRQMEMLERETEHLERLTEDLEREEQ